VKKMSLIYKNNVPIEIFSTRARFFLASLWWTQKVIQELGSSPLASVC
jgi:hypothetical protein